MRPPFHRRLRPSQFGDRFSIDAAKASILVRYMINSQQQLDQIFTALADGNRRAMIDALAGGDKTVSALAEPLGISLPATLQHLGVLEAAGLVHSSKQGRVRTCTLDTAALSQAETWISQRRAQWNADLDALGTLLARIANHDLPDRNRS